jgi:hypothetical protein
MRCYRDEGREWNGKKSHGADPFMFLQQGFEPQEILNILTKGVGKVSLEFILQYM